MYVNDVQAKLVLLYAVNGFDGMAVSQDYLLELLIESEILDYFTYAHYLKDLLDEDYLSSVKIEKSIRYDITAKGIEAVELLSKKIPPSVRSKIDTVTDEILGRFNRVQEVRGSTSAINERRFVAECGIYERNIPLLELNLTVGSETQARSVVNFFKENNTEIYEKIFKLFENQL